MTSVPRTSWLAPSAPTVAIELASHRVTVVELTRAASGASVSAQASEPLPEGVLTPSLTGVNVVTPPVVEEALRRALNRAGLASVKRAALVVPDTIARLSLLPFEQIPARQADLDQLVRWQVRKGTPFPIDDAQVTHFVASRDGDVSTLAAVVARRDVVAQYEAVAAACGIHAGLVDLASLNVMNAVIGAGAAPAGDWLLVHLAAEATSLAILRGEQLLFYRHRTALDEEPLGALVHQTSMYHEDRLGGGAFTRVWVSGSGSFADEARRDISARLGVPAEPVDVRPAADLRDRISATADVLDALAAPVGILLRERPAA